MRASSSVKRTMIQSFDALRRSVLSCSLIGAWGSKNRSTRRRRATEGERKNDNARLDSLFRRRENRRRQTIDVKGNLRVYSRFRTHVAIA